MTVLNNKYYIENNEWCHTYSNWDAEIIDHGSLFVGQPET